MTNLYNYDMIVHAKKTCLQLSNHTHDIRLEIYSYFYEIHIK